MTISAPGPRYPSLDIVRGVAVMGILAMNIQAFALPEIDYFMPIGPKSEGAANQISWLIDYIFFNGKMRSLFSILFGASCLLIIDRAIANGHSPAKVHYSRMIWLFLFGLAHLILIWWGDILAQYALAGMILYAARNLSVKVLWRWVAAMFVIEFLMFGVNSVLGTLMYSGVMPSSIAPEMVANMGDMFTLDAATYNDELALMRGGYAAIVADRWSMIGETAIFWVLMMPATLGLMFIGMALYKNGFLIGEWAADRYRRVAAWTLGIGLPVSIVMGFWAMQSGGEPIVSFAINLGYGAMFQIIMAIGYAAVLILWWQTGGKDGQIAAVLARTGQMAFTNYLGTSIIMTSIFYGYGLGLFGQVERFALWAFVLAAWAAMMAGSWYWLGRYQYGPLEWLWRSLARAKVQPMRRSRT
jgi:uncharacterized protein